MPLPSRDMDHLPALVKANNYSFYSDHGQYNLRKMYEDWRAGLAQYKVPRLCHLEHPEKFDRLPCLDTGRVKGGLAKDQQRPSLHSASSPARCHPVIPKKLGFRPSDNVGSRNTGTLRLAKGQSCYKSPARHPAVSYVGRFESVTKIGQGSYGNVFKCRNRDTGDVVAIKRFRETDDNLNIRRIAYREIRILKQLRHPHIVSLLEVFRRKKRIHLVFEYLDRTLLDEIQRNENGIPEEKVQTMMTELLQAVLIVHRSQFVHRDIKPENILLTRDGSIKLCDFGFARRINRISQENDQYTSYVATRWYRAPELLLGAHSYGPGVDIWAVGCVVYECITKCPLLPGVSDIDQLHLIEQMFGKNDAILPKGRQETLSTVHVVTDFRMYLERYADKIGLELRDVLVFILQTDPALRPSANKLLQAPYFSRETGRLDCENLKNHHRFVPSNRFFGTGLLPANDGKSLITNDLGYETASSPDETTESTDKSVEREDTPVDSLDTVREKPTHRNLPKISLESVQFSTQLTNHSCVSTGKSRVFARRPSLPKPDFLPNILA